MLNTLTGNQKRNILLGVVLLLVVGGIYFLNDSETGLAGKAEIITETNTETAAEKIAKYPRARELVDPAGFLNTPEGTTIEEFIGKKVILVDFWTYSCINCQRTQPYLNAWNEEYADDGLLIIGVHTPEFEFEKEIENVRRAVEEEGIEYPVVLDNDYATWAAYQNRYWPRKYLIDIDGFIVYDHIGEGAYDETEAKIRELLQERADRLGEDLVLSDMTAPQGVEEVAGILPRTPEIYFGAWRNEAYFGNGIGSAEGESEYTLPKTLTPNMFSLAGKWRIEREFASSGQVGAKIVLPYRAQKVFMVAHSKEGARVRVLIDGRPVGDRAGADVRDGIVDIKDEKLYRLIEADIYHTGTLELIVEEGEIEAFTFTFG